MELDMERLADAAMRTVGKMDAEDLVAMKVCLLSTGALAGLCVRNKFLRRTAGLACGVLAAGLAVPLASRYLEELREGDAAQAAETSFTAPEEPVPGGLDPEE